MNTKLWLTIMLVVCSLKDANERDMGVCTYCMSEIENQDLIWIICKSTKQLRLTYWPWSQLHLRAVQHDMHDHSYLFPIRLKIIVQALVLAYKLLGGHMDHYDFSIFTSKRFFLSLPGLWLHNDSRLKIFFVLGCELKVMIYVKCKEKFLCTKCWSNICH